jgi:signal transduction histidine kinase
VDLKMSSKSFQAPEQLVPKLGDTLVQMGLLADTELQHALTVQRQTNGGKLLGEILIDLEYINQETLNAAVTEQIFLLKSKLQRANQSLEKRVQQRTIELEEALTKLSELTQLKANFIANISHELRTPLTHIIGYLELMHNKDLGELNDIQLTALATMIRSSSQLERLINDLIMYTSMENEDIKLYTQTIDLSLVFSSTITKMQGISQKQNIQLQSNIEDGASFVEADQDKLQWVLIQLVENAIKFSPQGGNICLSARKEGNKIRISVSDEGIGIPEDQFQKIFNAFYQVDGSSTRKYGGTGMGLSLVKKILSLHNTEIQVSSKEKHGSEFTFLLQKPV